VPMVGLAGLVGLFVHGAAGQRLGRLVAASALPLSGLALLVRAVALQAPIDLARTAILEAEVGPPGLARREVLLLQAPTSFACLHPRAVWTVEGGAPDVRFWPLQMGRREVRWTRIDARTFELESRGAPFLAEFLETVFLADARPTAPGAVWTTSLFTAEAVAVDEAGLRRIRFRMAEPLEAPGVTFLTWRNGRWRRLAPPAAGETIELAAVTPPLPLLP
ncbi:MAG: hypothetical protein AB1726_02360, partial [Planctomycetota bacterium]